MDYISFTGITGIIVAGIKSLIGTAVCENLAIF
jgi:hypothetical protein